MKTPTKKQMEKYKPGIKWGRTYGYTEENGIKRFKGNRIVSWCLGNSTDLNQIWKMVNSGLFTYEELKEFYKLIGYSVNGYEEIFKDNENGFI